MGRRLGLVIGINHYQDAAFRPLRFAEIDAQALGQWLINAKGGSWNPNDVQLIIGLQATRSTIESLITHICVNVAGPEDCVFIYFAGHGFLDENNGEGYLAMADSHYQIPPTGLHLPTLMSQTMGRSQAAHILFIFDYFQTGRLWSSLRASPYDSKPLVGSALATKLQQIHNRYLFCSCRGNDFAPESSEQNLGLLTRRLILGLCGPAIDPTTNQVTLQRLLAYLTSTLDQQHRPQFFGQGQSPMVLVGNQTSPSTGPQAAQTKLSARELLFGPDDSSLEESASFLAQPQPTPFQSQPVPAVSSIAQLSPQRPTNGSGPLASAQAMMEQQRQQQANAFLQQARYMLQVQQPDQALLLIEQALQLHPWSADALILKGQLLGTLGRFPEAMSAVEQLLQIEPNHALAWSMRAALLANVGQLPEALQAIDHSIALDPSNVETQTIKSTIMVKFAVAQTPGSPSQPLGSASEETPAPPTARVFFAGVGLLLLGLVLGLGGGALSLVLHGTAALAGLALECLSLALLSVNAARGSFRYGFVRFGPTLLCSLLLGGLLAATLVIKSLQSRLFQVASAHPTYLIPLFFLGLWIALVAAIPFFAGIGALISRGVRKRR